MDASAEHSAIRPDYFGYYKQEIMDLLLHDEDCLPFNPEPNELSEEQCGAIRDKDKIDVSKGSASLFCNSVAVLSDHKKERLKLLLRQSVNDLSPEVDEMLDPVVAMRCLHSRFRIKKCLAHNVGAASDAEAIQASCKKRKRRTLSTLRYTEKILLFQGKDLKVLIQNLQMWPLSDKGSTNFYKKHCAHCGTKKTPQWRVGPGGPGSLCNASGLNYGKGREICLVSDIGADEGNTEVDDNLKFLQENDSLLVEETMKKHSNELSATLWHMELQLEEVLDTVVSSCRPMTLIEKRHLQKLIQKLPPKNLRRVVEIIHRYKPSDAKSHDEIFVDLEQEDNVTLWRLYFYVEAFEKARELRL